MVKFGELIMILELHRQGLKVAAIARQLGVVRKYISRRLEPPAYGPRPLRQKGTDPFLPYLGEAAYSFPWPHRGAAVAGADRAGLCRRLYRGEARGVQYQA